MIERNLWKGILCVLIAVMFLMPVNVATQKASDASRGNADADPFFIDDKNFVYVKANESRLSSVPVVCNDEVNLVPNPSFEEGSGRCSDSWRTTPNESLEKYHFWDSRCAFSGSKSIGFKDYIDDPGGSYDCWWWVCMEDIPVHPDEYEYKLSVCYKYSEDIKYYHDASHGLHINIWFYDKYSNHIGQTFLELPDAGLDWKYYSVNEAELEIPEDCHHIRIGMDLYARDKPSNNEIAFDDVFWTYRC